MVEDAVDAKDEGDWVEVRRATTPVEADMVRNFLRDHGVPSAINGDSGGTRLVWQQTMMDIRIVVAPSDLENAREVLTAMTAHTTEHPFRGAPPVARDEEEPYVATRSMMAAPMLAALVPIGAGHFYARHGAAGTILCAGVAGSFLGIMLGHVELAVTWGILVLVDIAGSVLAVKRFNAQQIPSEGVQRGWAIGAVMIAFAIGGFLGRS
jgi:hypothetical protein